MRSFASGLRAMFARWRIAAIARSTGFDLATRNTSDFEGCGIELHDPWNPWNG
jgi:predicted nucleic acid-binding protein